MSKEKQRQFMEYFERCHEPFVRYCTALAGSKMDAEDLIQEVLLSAYRQFEKIRQKDQLLHYLIKAARQRHSANWRQNSRRKVLLEKQQVRLQAKGVTPETLIDIQLLYAALEKLPERQKTALILFEINGFSMKEIAEIQNSTEAAVKMKISRGRKKLKQLLGDHPQAQQINPFLTLAKTLLL